MNLYLNGERTEVQATDLEALLHERGLADMRVATAVNGSFVAASERPAQGLGEGDRVEIVAPMQGG